MNSDTAAAKYRREAVENAPPVKVLRLLYQGALRFLDRAAACDPEDPGSQFFHWIYRTDAIVTELRYSLDAEQAPEISEQLRQLYLFTETQLARAIQTRDVEHVLNARQVLSTLGEAWAQVGMDASEAA